MNNQPPLDRPLPSGERYYGCLNCKREVTFSQVEYMSRVERDSFLLAHTCECIPGHVFERHLASNHMAIARLLHGLRPVLPYQAAPAESLPLTPSHEALLRVFGWECEHLDSVHEFLLLCSRPSPR